jgi:type III pantothenate kinase
MLLAYDIGNSDITMGLWNGNDWQVWRIPSRSDQPELFYGIKIRDSLLEANIPAEQINVIVISSVVPGLTDKIKNVVRSLFKREPILVGPGIYDKLPLEVLNPYEIGSDLVANAMAAYSLLKKTCIVVDFGTALTFTTVSGEGKILGVSIVPGLRTAVRALSQNTAKLFDVPLEMPTSALGRNTVTAIQSGIVIGIKRRVPCYCNWRTFLCYNFATWILSGSRSTINIKRPPDHRRTNSGQKGLISLFLNQF